MNDDEVLIQRTLRVKRNLSSKPVFVSQDEVDDAIASIQTTIQNGVGTWAST